MNWELIGEISHAETFAEGSKIRELHRLLDAYGGKNWQKLEKAQRFWSNSFAPIWRNVPSRTTLVRSAWHWQGRNENQGVAMKWTICIKNTGFEASLEARKLYNVEDDLKAQALGMIRVVDESGEGYLYPQEMFAPIAIQNSLEGQLLAA